MSYALIAAYCLVVTLLTLTVVAALLLLGIVAKLTWCKDVFRAGDKTLAAVLGGNGFYTISAHCGGGEKWYHRAGRVVIDGIFGTGHCADAAVRENLIPALGGEPEVQQGSANGSLNA